MRLDSLLELRRAAFRPPTTDSTHGLRVYLNLAARLTLTGPDQLWIADLTYIELRGEFVYLAVVLDRWSRKVIGWQLSRSLQSAIAVDALAGAEQDLVKAEDAFIAMRRARASYDAAARSLRLQQQSLDVEQARFDAGVSAAFMVILYQSYVAQARSTEVVAGGNYFKARAALDTSLGSSIEKHNISMDDAFQGRQEISLRFPSFENVRSIVIVHEPDFAVAIRHLAVELDQEMLAVYCELRFRAGAKAKAAVEAGSANDIRRIWSVDFENLTIWRRRMWRSARVVIEERHGVASDRPADPRPIGDAGASAPFIRIDDFDDA